MRASAKRNESSPPADTTESVARPQQRAGLETALFFLFVFTIYAVSPIVTSGDSRFVIPTDLSILRRGDADIDEYSHQFKEAPWAVRTENGHHWNVYPIGVPLLSLPWVWLLDKTYHLRGIDLEAEALRGAPLFEELLIASLFTAAAATLLFRIARKRLALPLALVLGLAFAFGTSAYSSASRGLVQHGPAMMLLAAAVLLFQRLPDWGTLGALSLGVVAGFSYVVRPANLIVILGFAGLIAVTSRARLAPYLLGMGLGVLPMLAFNRMAFGTWTSHYYRMLEATINLKAPPVKPALAVLLSPSRGLFVFSPFLLLAFARLRPSLLRRRPADLLEVVLSVFCLAWWFAVAKFPWWWGGGSYGPRLFSEVALYLAILMIPVLEDISRYVSFGRRLLAVILIMASTLSIAIHFRAATSWAVWEWNSLPVSIDQSPERVWEWRDPQFLRGFGRRAPARLSFYTLTPCRAVDTRLGSGPWGGPSLSAGEVRTFPMYGQCGIPVDARSLVLNVTVTQPTAPGDVLLFPGYEAVPVASTINFATGQTRANSAIIALASNGSGHLSVKDHQASGGVHLILDVTGYFK